MLAHNKNTEIIWKITGVKCCVYFLSFLRGTELSSVLKKET
jgi:hypothetical protein